MSVFGGRRGAPSGDHGASGAGWMAAWSSLLSVGQLRAQPGDGLAGGDPLGVDGDVALQRAGERRAHLVLADVAEHGADLDRGPSASPAAG